MNLFYLICTGFQSFTKVLKKQRYIAGSFKCSTKPLSLLLSSEGETSRVLHNYILQKWCESDVDIKKI